MKYKLFDSELKLMEILWQNGSLPAKEVAKIAAETIGWNKNTTYTVIKKLIGKNAVRRSEPEFFCTPLIEKAEIRRAETNHLIEKLYNGSRQMFFAGFAGEPLTEEEADVLRALIDKRR